MSTKQIGPENWEFRAFAPKPGGGRTHVHRRGFPTQKAARDAEAELRGQVARGGYVLPPNVTVSEYLTGTWLPAKAHSVKLASLASYRLHVESYVVPILGKVRLRDLDGAALSRLYATLLSEGRLQRPGGLSAKTVRNIAGTIHKAMADAVRWRVLPFNPAQGAEVPRAELPELKVWNAEQLATFFRFTAGDRFCAMWRLFGLTGMRRGELCGLRWTDVDLDAGRLTISQTRTVVQAKAIEGSPKTRAGVRAVALDRETVAALRSWRATQAAERLAVGPGEIPDSSSPNPKALPSRPSG